jgi:hypothetical protein
LLIIRSIKDNQTQHPMTPAIEPSKQLIGGKQRGAGSNSILQNVFTPVASRPHPRPRASTN